MTWTQPICRACWYHRNPGRNPVQMTPEWRETEVCCWCGKDTTDGIYVREDPAVVPYPAKEDT